jgi:hypothetical protein
MKYVLLALLIICALGAWPLINPQHEAAVITPSQVVSGVLVIPALIISVVGFLTGLVFVGSGSLNRVLGICYLCLASVLPLSIATKKARFSAAFDQRMGWFKKTQGGGAINFYIHRILAENPSAVHYLGDSEEVTIDGLAAMVRRDSPVFLHDSSGRRRPFVVEGDSIKTPWGAVVRYAVDRDGDGFLTAGQIRGSTQIGTVSPWTNDPKYQYTRATGVFVSMPDPVLGEVDTSFVALDDNDYNRLREIQEWSISYYRK